MLNLHLLFSDWSTGKLRRHRRGQHKRSAEDGSAASRIYAIWTHHRYVPLGDFQWRNSANSVEQPLGGTSVSEITRQRRKD